MQPEKNRPPSHPEDTPAYISHTVFDIQFFPPCLVAKLRKRKKVALSDSQKKKSQWIEEAKESFARERVARMRALHELILHPPPRNDSSPPKFMVLVTRGPWESVISRDRWNTHMSWASFTPSQSPKIQSTIWKEAKRERGKKNHNTKIRYISLFLLLSFSAAVSHSSCGSRQFQCYYWIAAYILSFRPPTSSE